MYDIDCDCEVAVLGAGIAGLSSALTLARARVETVIVGPDAPGLHNGESRNWLTNDGAEKADILRRGAEDVMKYREVTRRVASATAISRDAFGYEVTLDDASTLTARRLIVATGLGWAPGASGIEGLDDRLGRDVFTCPYCHGYEIADRKFALIGTQKADRALLKLLSNWSARLDYVTHDGPGAADVEPDFAAYSDGEIHAERITAIEGAPGAPVLVAASGARIDAEAVFVSDIPGATESPLVDGLGIERGLHPQTGRPIYKTDATGRTDLGDLFIVGDLRTGFSTLAGASSEGMVAGFMMANDVIEARLVARGAAVRDAA